MSRVLIVDDAGLFQALESSFLKRTGCTIVRAVGATDLLGKARAQTPDLILLDAAHPGLDVPSCLRELKGDAALRAIPVVVVTDAAGVAACCEAGADAALARPLQGGALEMLLCTVGRVVHREQERRGARIRAQVASPAGDVRGVVKDISRSGMFLALPRPLPVDVPVRVSMRLPGGAGEERLQAKGVVVRQVGDEPDSHLIPGVGVRFVALDELTAARIEHFISHLVDDERDPLEVETGKRDDA
jgi:CheY-like chemotaxis protein